MLSIIIVIIGALAGIYLGVFVLFIGGILQIAKNLDPINTIEIAYGVIKILFSWLGWVIFLASTFIAGLLVIRR